jgi:pilus assembly protein FimV
LTVLSGSGEPLRAQIEVTAIQPGEAESLRASLAPADIYRQTQLDHPDFLSSVRLSVTDLPDGRKVVSVSSDAPIEARVVDLLVDLNWASGRFIRQYSFFVDPPAPVRSAAPTTDIRVVRGDTLSGVAKRIAAPGANLEQVLVALQQANPSAFDSGNVNRLRAGSTLRVPDADTIRAIDQQAARRNLATQQAEFERQRVGRGAAAVRRSGAAATPQQASGAISATSSDKPAPSTDERDRLRLSSAAPTSPSTSVGTRGTAGALNAAASQDAADRSAEELAAKGKALQEAQSRVSELERNVADMQRLLGVQSAALAEAEARASAASAAALAAPSAPSVSAPATAPLTVAPVVPGETPAATSEGAKPAAAADTSATDGLAAYATPQRLGIALLVILVLLLIALLIARRRREQRLSALAAGAALATAAAPAWAEPATPVRAVDVDEEDLEPRVGEPVAPVRPVDFGFSLDLDKPTAAEAAARASVAAAVDDEPPRLVKSSADVQPEPIVAAAPARPAYKNIEEDWPKPEPEPVRPAAAAFAPLVTPDPAAGVDLTEDNASKLELADAYLEIGDKEGARELLEDVIKGGTAAQQERAKETLASLR